MEHGSRRLNLLKCIPGATPLDPDAAAGLVPELTTQAELNEFEAANILTAMRWAMGSRCRLRRDYPADHGLRELHRRMFNETWRWAGMFRTTATNLGVPVHQIASPVRDLCENVHAQIECASYPWPELAVRFHRDLVWIYPFPNGSCASLKAEREGLPLRCATLNPIRAEAAHGIQTAGVGLEPRITCSKDRRVPIPLSGIIALGMGCPRLRRRLA